MCLRSSVVVGLVEMEEATMEAMATATLAAGGEVPAAAVAHLALAHLAHLAHLDQHRLSQPTATALASQLTTR